MGRPSKDATPCALPNKNVQLCKECDVRREAAEQPGGRRQWLKNEWQESGLQCARIATGPTAPEFCAPADADRPRRARAPPAAAPEAAPLRDKRLSDDHHRLHGSKRSGAGRHYLTSPVTPAARATSGLSGTATHILSLAGEAATAQILRGDATTSKPIAQLSKKRKTAVTQSAAAVLGGAASMIAPADPDGLLVAVAAHVQTKRAREAQRESDPKKKKKLQTTVVADLSTAANTATVQRFALDIKGKPRGKAASTRASSAAADSAADAAKVAADPAVEVKIGKETIEWRPIKSRGVCAARRSRSTVAKASPATGSTSSTSTSPCALRNGRRSSGTQSTLGRVSPSSSCPRSSTPGPDQPGASGGTG